MGDTEGYFWVTEGYFWEILRGIFGAIRTSIPSLKKAPQLLLEEPPKIYMYTYHQHDDAMFTVISNFCPPATEGDCQPKVTH